MGYALAMGHCMVCQQVFAFNPVKVPSFRDERQERQPVCRHCITHINTLRVANGVGAFVIPEDAYDPVDENELPDE